MPIARGPQINARSALLVGATGVIIAFLLGGMVLWVSNSSDAIELNLGDRVFDAGFVGRQSEEISARGPILYADAGSSGQRDLFLQHIGDDPDSGWLAFSARRVGDPRDCSAVWDRDDRIFELTSSTEVECDTVTFSELGCGLFRYPAEVIDGKVTVFLNEDFDEVAEVLDSGEGESDAEPEEPGPDLSCP